jgi:hypothetical protein
MRPLLVQHHIPKTAGTSLRQIARANYRPSEVEDIETLFGVGRIRPDWRWSRAIRRYGDAYHSLPREHRERVRCFIGHTAPLLLPAVDDRPVRAFTMLRDPVERVISLWSHAQWLVDHGHPTAWAPLVAAMRERRWSLADAYRELGDGRDARQPEDAVFAHLFNEQSRQVLLGVLDPRDVPFTADEGRLDPYRRRAFEFLSTAYVVGAQERFSQSARLFADSFGWRRVFVPRVNVRRAAIEVDDETRSLIRDHNRLDAELHRHYLEQLAPLPGVSRSARLRGGVYRSARPVARRTRRALRRFLPRALRDRRRES